MAMDEFLVEYLKDPENLRGFQRADLQVEIALQVERAMKAQRISRKELATRMGVSKGRVTQILCGTSNLTLRLVSDVFTALGLKLELRPVALQPIASTSRNVSQRPGHARDLPSNEIERPDEDTANRHSKSA